MGPSHDDPAAAFEKVPATRAVTVPRDDHNPRPVPIAVGAVVHNDDRRRRMHDAGHMDRPRMIVVVVERDAGVITPHTDQRHRNKHEYSNQSGKHQLFSVRRPCPFPIV
jgi:hypothetical protein